jgi:hypothetical protein
VENRSAIAKRRLEQPHLWNLNEDPALTDMIVHFIDRGIVRVGTVMIDPELGCALYRPT